MPSIDDLAKQLGKQFIERRDVKAVQRPNGAYTPERTPWTLQDLRDHLENRRTLGHYLISAENKCRLFAYDLDVMKDPRTNTPPEDPIIWTNPDGEPEAIDPRAVFLDREHWAREYLVSQLNTLALVLARKAHKLWDVPVAAAYSGGKGLHVYAFTGSQDSSMVRDAALGVLESFGDRFRPTRGSNFFRVDGYVVDVEVFPKQSDLDGKDLGNLMRLPLGTNLKTGDKGRFLRLRQGSEQFTPMAAQAVLLDGVLPW